MRRTVADLTSHDNIFLVGFMGTGKTEVGKALAQLMGWEFVDMDTVLETNAGKSVQRVFAEEGEPAFRDMEKTLLEDVCSGSRRVISTGGGVVLDESNRLLMRSRGLVVLLDALPETIYTRLTSDDTIRVETRPLLSGSQPLDQIKELKGTRDVIYEATAHHIVDTERLNVDQVAEKVLEVFNKPQRH